MSDGLAQVMSCENGLSEFGVSDAKPKEAIRQIRCLSPDAIGTSLNLSASAGEASAELGPALIFWSFWIKPKGHNK
jgi:hypothetical protein